MSRHAAPRPRRLGPTVLVLGTVAGAVLLPTGIAHAYWRTAGIGTGTASGGILSPLVAQTATAAGATLGPGGSGTLTVTVTNPNPVDVTVTAVSGNGTVGAGGGLGSCTNFVVAVQTPTAGLPVTVPAGATVTLTLAHGIAMTSADNGCQGASFTVPVTLTGRTS